MLSSRGTRTKPYGSAHQVFQQRGSGILGLPRWHSGKESICNSEGPGLILESGKIPWRREWQPTPVFLPGEFQGWRNLAGSSPWGHKESDTTEWLTLSLSGIITLKFISASEEYMKQYTNLAHHHFYQSLVKLMNLRTTVVKFTRGWRVVYLQMAIMGT